VSALPHIDDHDVRIGAPADVVFEVLRRYVDSMLSTASGHLLARLLGTDPPAGFAVTEVVPSRLLRLAGRHRFARYQLVFELDQARGGTVLRARSYGEFPGLRGRAYRAAVIGTRGHIVATRHILRSIRRQVESARRRLPFPG
jgi:hypothetical protein